MNITKSKCLKYSTTLKASMEGNSLHLYSYFYFLVRHIEVILNYILDHL